MSGEYDELIGKMTSLTGDELPKMKRKALRRVGKLVKDVMVFGCPVKAGTEGGQLQPGEMKADIRATVHIAQDKNAASDEDRVSVGPGKKTEHVAVWVELGHVNRRGRKSASQTSHGNTPAHPFVRPAADITRNTAPELFVESMSEDIAQVMNA